MTRTELVEYVAREVWRHRDPKWAIGNLLSELDRGTGPRARAARHVTDDSYGKFERAVLRTVMDLRAADRKPGELNK